MVTVGDITRFLVPRGYTLAVTLEIADATLGGLAFGVGMTTYSHKVGLYQETIEEYEVVLGDGSVVCARRDNEHSDLYHCLPWSHGSLGFLVSLSLKIIPVKPYIHMKYIPVRGQKEYCDMIRDISGPRTRTRRYPTMLRPRCITKRRPSSWWATLLMSKPQSRYEVLPSELSTAYFHIFLEIQD